MGKHVTMPCGWNCGTKMTARSVREHFATCPNRDKPNAIFERVESNPVVTESIPAPLTPHEVVSLTHSQARERFVVPNCPNCHIGTLRSIRTGWLDCPACSNSFRESSLADPLADAKARLKQLR